MAGLTYDGIPSTEIDSTTFSGANFYATDGQLLSNGLGSPATYGAKIQAGTAGPLLGATGSIVFGTQFADTSFVVTITPQVSGTLYPYVASGTATYSVSGITYGGQSGLAYNWIAVGV